MSKLFNPDYLKHLCHQYGFHPGKKYGQNYLIDETVIDDIIGVAQLSKGDTVVEVGPGFGTLTLALAQKVKKVIAFEIEKKLQVYWDKEIKKLGNLEIVWGNVLVSLRAPKERGLAMPQEANPTAQGVSKQGDRDVPLDSPRGSLGVLAMTQPYKVVANLPYQITSPVIRLFLEAKNPPAEMILMVQKEVGERICAKPGDMSLLSVAVQYYATAEIVRLVPRASFWPAPKVDSAILRVSLRGAERRGNPRGLRASLNEGIATPRLSGARDDTQAFFQIVKAGFAQRRKLLVKNLEPLVGKKNRAALLEAFAAIGLTPQARAQELSVEQWRLLTNELNKLDGP